MDNNEKSVFDVKALQEYLGIGRRQAYELIREDKFPVKKIGTKIIVPKAGVDNWLHSPGYNDILSMY